MAAAQDRKRGAPRVVEANFVDSIDNAAARAADRPEVAFGGRSNVGKSSLLNMLCQRRGLARTSKTPGRTQRINLFDVRLSTGQELRLADLPGWGHAKVPRRIRDAFGPMIESYLLERSSLAGLFLLVDARRDPDPGLGDFAEWLAEREVAVTLVATKVDKIPRNRQLQVLSKLAKGCRVPGPVIASSSSDGSGGEELWRRIVALTGGGDAAPKGPKGKIR